MAKHATGRLEKLGEEEYSGFAVVAGMGAAIGTAAFVTAACKKFDIPVKGLNKVLKPLAIYGIARWVSNEAMFATADEAESTLSALKEAKLLVEDLRRAKKKTATVINDEEDKEDEQ